MKNINKKFLLCAKTPHNLMLHGVNAVSYTHLDVYKRQVVSDKGSIIAVNGRRGIEKNRL